jgi:hypothetical protein
MDMNAGYIRAARIHLPCAVDKIAFDRFHVAKQLGEVVIKPARMNIPVFRLKAAVRPKIPASCGSTATNG